MMQRSPPHVHFPVTPTPVVPFDIHPGAHSLDYQRFPTDLQKYYFGRDVLQDPYRADLQIRGPAFLALHEPM